MDSNAGGTGAQSKSVVDGIIKAATGVITNPVEFFRTMPKTGGFGDPLVFAVVIGVVIGVLQVVINLVMFHTMGLSAMPFGNSHVREATLGRRS